MMYAGRVILVTAMVAASVVSLPNHLKAVVVDTDPIPVKGTSVSASFGGYSATAGLGGSGTGGGLFAAAASPHGSANAGLGGSVAGESTAGGLGASASSGGPSVSTGGQPGFGTGGYKPGGYKPGNHPPTFFDDIFNIPISVLHSVNTYLNNRGPVTKTFRRRGHYHPEVVHKTVTPVQTGSDGSAPEVAAGTHTSAGTAAESGVHSSAGTVAESGVHSSVGAGVGGPGPVVVHKRVNYDDIFNIPISVLKSVNHMLNGKK